MALNKTTLRDNISNRVQEIDLQNSNVADAIAEIIADEVDSYIKGATITVPAGIPVSTTGTAAAQSGATTGPGDGTIS